MADFYCADCGKYGSCEKQSIHSIPKGWVNNKTYGWGIKTYCSEACKRNAEGASKKVSTAGANQSQSGSNYVQPPIQKSAEQIRAEAEADKVRHQIEMEEREEVRKADKEFFDSIKKNWKTIVVVAIVLAIGIGVIIYINNNSKQNDAKLSLQLEQIEDNVKLAIQSGDKEKALSLANQLIHDSHGDMESQKFNNWSGYPKYDEYWSKKREEYKTQIMAMGSKKNVGGESMKNTERTDSNINVNKSEQNGELEPSTAVCVSDKAYFYKEPDLETIRKAFIVKDQEITYDDTTDEFVFATFTNENGVKTQGWILKTDLDIFQ